MGLWYQQAATKQPFLTGCTCVSAEYSLNVCIWITLTVPIVSLRLISQTNGTVNVLNKCQRFGKPSSITGLASPSEPQYGKGAFNVEFPNIPKLDPCGGSNYIVQGIIKMEEHNFT
jgi:apolipoprotein D and lipocalin family protein